MCACVRVRTCVCVCVCPLWEGVPQVVAETIGILISFIPPYSFVITLLQK